MPRLQQIDLAVESRSRPGEEPRVQADVRQRRAGEYPWYPRLWIVNSTFDAEESRIAAKELPQIDGNEAGLPIVAMQDLRPEQRRATCSSAAMDSTAKRKWLSG